MGWDSRVGHAACGRALQDKRGRISPDPLSAAACLPWSRRCTSPRRSPPPDPATLYAIHSQLESYTKEQQGAQKGLRIVG